MFACAAADGRSADGTAFFSNSGIKDPFLTQVATNIVNVFMTIPGMWGVEHYGRRNLLIYGAAWMTICEFLVAIIGVTISVENQSGQKALIALVCLYIAGFASTWGPIAWVIVGEIFPLAIRAKAMSLSVASNWLWNFAISYATPYLVNPGPGNAGLGVKVFFIWGSTCLGCLIFTYFCRYPVLVYHLPSRPIESLSTTTVWIPDESVESGDFVEWAWVDEWTWAWAWEWIWIWICKCTTNSYHSFSITKYGLV